MMAFMLPVSYNTVRYITQLTANLFALPNAREMLSSVKLIKFTFMRFKDEKLTVRRKSQSTFQNK